MMGTAILPLNVTAEIAPLASVFVYVILSHGKIAADTERFSIAKCFNNKVTMDFSKQEASPGSTVTLRVKADPGSLCSVRAVDDGVLFLTPEAEISRDVVYSFVSRRNQFGYPYAVRDVDAMCRKPGWGYSYSHYSRKKRSYQWPNPPTPDVGRLLKQIGLKFITNFYVKTPTDCVQYPIVAAMNSYGIPAYDNDMSFPRTITVDDFDDSLLHVITISELTNTIRTKFPEAWIWKLVTVGPSGQIDLQLQLPDSITEWKTTAFCMGDSGLGIAPTTSVQAFQPYFIHLKHPNVVVKGETFSLSARVFNYLSSPLMVKIYIKESQDLQMSDCPKCNIPQCLLPQQTIEYTWGAKALHIGAAEIQLRTEAINTQELCDGQRPIVPHIGASDSLMKTVLVK